MTFARAVTFGLSTLAAVGLAVAFSACIQIGPSADDDDAAAAPPTVQDQCAEIMSAFCSQSNACLGTDVSACFKEGVDSCSAGAAAKVATSTEKDIQNCVADVGKEDCQDVSNQKLPPRCQGVVTHD
ncbi:MAG TPA: hypothetical protein VGQ57_08985 [Polyangiaceae bacterium]|nr:hypothetical protein [Polyangiaceae bacterium]